MDGSHGLPPGQPIPVGHEPEHGGAEAHVSLKSYLIGFALAVALTAVPFGLVMAGALPTQTLVPICVGFAVVQMVVHLVFFLHMNTSSSQWWNNAAFVFTLIIVAIVVGGSIWVMYHLNTNMMPGMMPAE